VHSSQVSFDPCVLTSAPLLNVRSVQFSTAMWQCKLLFPLRAHALACRSTIVADRRTGYKIMLLCMVLAIKAIKAIKAM
jgi:hypothetical protein